MNIMYIVRDRETGSQFGTEQETLEQAIELVDELILEDKQSGSYEEDYYEICEVDLDQNPNWKNGIFFSEAIYSENGYEEYRA